MGNCILNDDRDHALGMSKREAKADWAAVIVYIERILFQAENLGEAQQ